MKGIILDSVSRTLKVRRIREGRMTHEGRVVWYGGSANIAGEGHVWTKQRFFGLLPDAHLIILREGDPQPLGLDGKFAEYDSAMLGRLLKSNIAYRFMQPGFDWKIVLLILAIVVIIAQAAGIASLAGVPSGG